MDYVTSVSKYMRDRRKSQCLIFVKFWLISRTYYKVNSGFAKPREPLSAIKLEGSFISTDREATADMYPEAEFCHCFTLLTLTFNVTPHPSFCKNFHLPLLLYDGFFSMGSAQS